MLKVENLHVSYGEIKALKGISFSINEGEIVTLIGANGAGKTTTLQTISGIIKAQQGSIIFQGKNITNLDSSKLVEMGIIQIPEGRRIFPKMTVKENLEMGAYQRKDTANFKNDYEMVFNYFPILKERINQLGGTLSGGEQQMLAVARGLMAKPKLLLLDEPSLGLAPLIVKKIFEIIKKINDQGTTLLLVEQNAYQALQIADRGYVIETGTIALSGPAAEIMNNDHVRKAYLGEG